MQTRQQKEQLVQEVVDQIKSSKALVFTDYKGVNVSDLTSVRGELRKSGSSFKVLKKTLLDIALREAGVKAESKPMTGQIGVAFSADEVAAAKVIADFLKANKESSLNIQGGALEGEGLTPEQVVALSKLPSKEELYGKLVGTLAAPMSGFVRALSGNLSGLVGVLKAIEKQKA